MNHTSDTTPADITVRPMRPEEKPEVRKMFRRSFPLLLRLFFSWTPYTLVAEGGGKLLGATVLKTYPLPEGRKGGFVSWIFTAPEARGSGAGQHLIEAALDLFESQGCHEVPACVEGYNASSSKLFSTRGLSILNSGRCGSVDPEVGGTVARVRGGPRLSVEQMARIDHEVDQYVSRRRFRRELCWGWLVGRR